MAVQAIACPCRNREWRRLWYPRHSGPRMQRIAVLGSTGSIGTSCLEVIAHLQQICESLPYEKISAELGERDHLAADQYELHVHADVETIEAHRR